MGDIATWSATEIAIVFLAWVGVIAVGSLLGFACFVFSDWLRNG